MQSRTTSGAGWRKKSIIAMLAACCLLLFAGVSAFANTVNIYDNANVLNKSQVQSQASALNYPVSIYTTNAFTGSTSAFDQQAASHIGGNANLIVLAIDTLHKHVTVTGGKNVPLSNSQYSSAAQAFVSSYTSGGYTGATDASLQSLQNMLGSANSGGNNQGTTQPVRSSSGGGFSFAPLLCCVGLLVVAGLGVFVFVRRRAGGLGGRRGPINPNPMNPGYPQQNYNPNFPNQGYPQNYGPGYNQGGVNPLIPGGIGAVGGGLLGYELGKAQGENEGHREGGNYGNDNDNNGGFGGGGNADFGNNGGNNFGGGGSADFGNSGGNDSFGGGGGADFGGGGGGGFGGGGSDFGGGGGDSGGGGGGSF